jgi:hypothetical protein
MLALLYGAACALEAEAIGPDVGLGHGFDKAAAQAVVDRKPEVEYPQSFGTLDGYFDAVYPMRVAVPTSHDGYLEARTPDSYRRFL